ncbi:unnamed protein product [Diabrotica balteata]|uniref:Reverse transcriptase domain-containing protein n=1 Tax=Diabrotica balteata TaxID=107213 RepID=A0A9N9SLZ2_DIABA|nr:unnamed protein product [Diabrotica balteata]
MYKKGGDQLFAAIHKLIVLIWQNEWVPEEWLNGIICALHKKGDQLESKTYRGITLFASAYKIFGNVLFERLKHFKKDIVGQYQCGFTVGKSTTHQI